jgi:hypothetical protein
MSQTLRKRACEPEAQMDSMDVREPKRFHGEETDRFLHLLQLDKTLADDEEEECVPSEELVEGVMRSLEEEIGMTCSTSYPSSCSDVNSVASDISSGKEGQNLDSDSVFDLCHLLEASDDELGIPPSPVQDLKDELCLSPNETSEGLSESRDLKSLGDNWHFEDDFENYQQFALYEDAWDASQLRDDYMNRDFVSQGLLFDGDFSEAWRLDTASCI